MVTSEECLITTEQCYEKTPARSSGMTLREGKASVPRLPTDGRDERPRILLADDNGDMRVCIRRLLSDDYDVQAVADGQEAWNAAQEAIPDLVLSDVMMPGLDGFGLLRRLRAEPSTREVPVILLSARAGEEARVEGLEAGADDYLTKPFSARELLACVQARLQLAKVRRESREALRQSEEAVRRLAAIVESSDDAIISKNLDGTIVSWNKGAERLYGYRAEEIVGKPLAILVPPDHPDEVPSLIERLKRGEHIEHYETVRVAKDGRRIDVSLTISPVRDVQGKVVGASKIARDVSERKRTEAALRRSEQALKEANRRKDEFLAMLAHELRNPLAPIRNAVQILRAKGPPEPELQWARDVIDRQVRQMTRMVDDLLDVSRISNGKIELRKERVELTTIVNSAVEASGPLIEKWGHELTVKLPPGPLYLDADQARLTQVLLNLLNNAAKYTEQGGRIRLTAARDGERIAIRVKDTGIGIPREMLPRIFDIFTQVDRSLERSEGGLGIGLALVQSLVKMHGGTVEAYSDGPGKGSEFVVYLPLAPHVKDRGIHGNGGEAMAPLPCRILVVDDNRDSAKSLGILLRIMGNEVHTAHDGLEAVGAAGVFRPNVVLLDIGLPKLNGYEAARRIREQLGAGVALIALTGWGQDDDRRRSKEAGFDYHMTKPVDLDELSKLLGELKTTAS
jgi:PAS domain S-box-containing protein